MGDHVAASHGDNYALHFADNMANSLKNKYTVSSSSSSEEEEEEEQNLVLAAFEKSARRKSGGRARPQEMGIMP